MIAKKIQKSAEKSNAIAQLSINHYSAFVRWHDNENGGYQCTRTLLISTTMPHPDSLLGIGTSRTTTPGSNDIQVMACSVPGLPRLAMRLPSKIRKMSVAPSWCDGSSGTGSTTASARCCSLMLALPLCVTATKERQVECSSPSMDQ